MRGNDQYNQWATCICDQQNHAVAAIFPTLLLDRNYRRDLRMVVSLWVAYSEVREVVFDLIEISRDLQDRAAAHDPQGKIDL